MEDLKVGMYCDYCKDKGFTDRKIYLDNAYPDFGVTTHLDNPSFNLEKYLKYKSWGLHKKKGLWIYGESGSCKSRILRLLAIEALMQHPDKCFKVFYGSMLNKSIINAWKSNNVDALKELITSKDLIVIDDFSVESLGGGALQDFFGIIDTCYRENKVKFLIASNLNPEDISERLSRENGSDMVISKSIIRRLMDMCNVRNVTKVVEE